MISTLCVSATLLSLMASSGQDTVTEVQVGSRKVAFSWPKDRAPDRFRFEWSGLQVEVGHRGELMSLMPNPVPWDLVRSNYAKAQARQNALTRKWRAKIFVLPRIDILNRGEILRTRKNWLEKEEIDAIYHSLAEWKVLCEAQTGGSISLDFDVEVDSEEILAEAAPDSVPLDTAWLNSFVASRVNDFDFGSDDGVFRGPFDSVTVVHGGLISKIDRTVVWETPTTSVPYVQFNPSGKSLGLAFFELWQRDALFASQRQGYLADAPVPAQGQLGSRLSPLLPVSSWLTALSSRSASSEQYSARQRAKPTIEGVPYSQVADDPIGRVGQLSQQDIEGLLGAKLQVSSAGSGYLIACEGLPLPMISGSTSLDSLYDPHSESAAIVVGKGQTLLLVASPYTGLYGEAHPEAKFHGFFSVAGNRMAVFSNLAIAGSAQECDLVNHPMPKSVKPGVENGSAEIFSGDAAKLELLGQFTAEGATDPDRGAVARIDIGKRMRWGSATVFDSPSSYINARSKPIFTCWVKSGNCEPILIELENTLGERFYGRMFGRWPTPEDGEQTPAVDTGASQDNEWHQVSLDLRALGATGGKSLIRRVAFVSDPLAQFWGKRAAGTASLLLGSCSFEATTSPVKKYDTVESTQPDKNSLDPVALSLWAASCEDSAPNRARLIELLGNRSTLVRTNAAYAFQRIKAPEAEPALIQAINSLDSRLVQAVVEALKFQATPAAWAEIRRTFLGPPSEASRIFAARALESCKEPWVTGTLSSGYAARSWQARQAVSKAISAVGSKESNLLQVVFLQEVVPELRLAVASRLDTSVETICRRLMYTAVNDPSDAVRAMAAWKLATSPLPQFQVEGWKSIRDDSPFVRLFLLSQILAAPTDSAKPTLRLALQDADPRVRSAALMALGKMPGDISGEDFSSIRLDNDIRVQRAWELLRSSRGLP